MSPNDEESGDTEFRAKARSAGARNDDKIERTLRDSTPTRFAAGFGDRVAARLASESARAVADATVDFTAALQRQFVRIVPIVAAASLILGLYSWWGGRSSSDSVLDATLHLPQVSIAAVYGDN
jgi:hypothetical protein